MPEWIALAIVALPAPIYLVVVWLLSEAEQRAFSRFVGQFDEVTRDHRRQTPRVRMTLYQRLVDKTRRTQRIAVPPAEETDALRHRRRVFLRLKSPQSDTVRIPVDDQITLRMRR